MTTLMIVMMMMVLLLLMMMMMIVMMMMKMMMMMTQSEYRLIYYDPTIDSMYSVNMGDVYICYETTHRIFIHTNSYSMR